MSQMSIFGPTLSEAKQEVARSLDGGIACPCCSQWAQRYRTPIGKTMIKVLLLMARYHRDRQVARGEFIHVENYLVEIGSKIKGVHGKMEHWGLLEPRPNDDPTKKSSGFWRITQLGWDFIERRTKIPKYAHLFNGQCTQFEGPEVSITESFPAFDYEKIMRGEL